MSTFSTRLGLKLNSTSDPFQLSDFLTNWGILDASPGTFVCTSTSRPSWGTAQAGQLIFMTDLKQLSYWTGTTWADLRDSAPVFTGGSYLNATLTPNSNPVFQTLTFTTPRPSAISMWVSGTYAWANNKTQDAFQQYVFDGVAGYMGGFREQIRFAGNSGDSGSLAGMNVMTMGVIPSVTAGQHKVGIQVNMGSYPTSVILVGVKALVMISLFASNNVL